MCRHLAVGARHQIGPGRLLFWLDSLTILAVVKLVLVIRASLWQWRRRLNVECNLGSSMTTHHISCQEFVSPASRIRVHLIHEPSVFRIGPLRKCTTIAPLTTAISLPKLCTGPTAKHALWREHVVIGKRVINT
jgi:hypothetical protein